MESQFHIMNLGEEFPITRRLVYLNSASTGAVPASTIRLLRDYMEERCRWMGGEEWLEGGDRWSKMAEESRRLFAEIIGACEDEVAFIPNTTTGINTALSMIPMRRGQNIVATSISYPMGAIVSLKQRERGVEVRFAENRNGIVELEEFERLIDDETAAVLVDQAGWYNGLIHDIRSIAEMAHDHGAYLVVDAVQSAGALRLRADADGIDFLAVSTYKWLLGGPYSQTVGFLYINREHIDSFQPPFVGNQSIDEDQLQANIYDRFDLYDLKYRRGIRRLQIYPRYEMAYVAVGNSMKILLREGLEKIERRIKGLGTILIEGLLDSGFELQTPVDEERRLFVNVKVRDNRRLEAELYSRKIAVSARVGGLRISPHLYNSEEDIEALLRELRALKGATM